jgi:hypothetical protein
MGYAGAFSGERHEKFLTASGYEARFALGFWAGILALIMQRFHFFR